MAFLFSTVARPSGSVYSFHKEANTLLKNFFPNNVFPNDVRITRVVFEPIRPPRDAEDFFELQMRANEAISKDASQLRFSGEILDSPYATISHVNGFEPTLLLRSPFYDENLNAVRSLSEDELNFGSVREKMLFQRDLFQIMHVVYRVFISVRDEKDINRARILLDELFVLFPKTFLTETELEDIRSRELEPGGYSSINTWKMENNYLPDLLFGNEPRFAKIPLREDQSIHFTKHSGRSFFYVYIKVPDWSGEKVINYWREVSSQHGEEGEVENFEVLPAGTETMLTRSAGVFLADGTYADSGVFEEVLLRIFKHAIRTLDVNTTDFWGTNYSEFVLDRTRFLKNHNDIALKEKSMDSLSYWGFWGEAYDPSPMPFPAITTMKWNCYTCHALVGYGSETILTMRLQDPSVHRGVKRHREYLNPVRSKPDRFELVSPLMTYARSLGHFRAAAD